MDESKAWLHQATADRQAAERFVADEAGTGRCHAIAKWQQTVEKAIKAVVSALHDAGILSAGIRFRHEVEPYVSILLKLPRTSSNKEIQQILHGILDQNTRAGIKALDALAPQRDPQRNTEYPFQDTAGQWTYPANEDIFSQDEMQRFRTLAHRLLDGATRIVSAIRRRPGLRNSP